MMERPWLFVGCKLVCVDNSAGCGLSLPPGAFVVHDRSRPNLTVGATYTVSEIRHDEPGDHIDKYDPVKIDVVLAEVAWPIGFRLARFKPLHDNSKTIEALKQAMRDHVANASGGMGIKPRVGA